MKQKYYKKQNTGIFIKPECRILLELAQKYGKSKIDEIIKCKQLKLIFSGCQ